MTDAALTYRWSREAFVRAWEAGAFDRRVELVDGEVWPVVIGPWHGDATARVARALPGDGARITTATLPAGDSLPDPDCWVRRAGAEPLDTIGSRLVAWRPEDVLLVVEVADETVVQDLTVKARLYGGAGYDVYWVVTRDVIYEHIEPTPEGYRVRVEHRPGDHIAVGYAGTDLAVGDLLAGEDS
ncbi:MAG: Uma2 family endonuclease [Acidimicrobiales bacterium]